MRTPDLLSGALAGVLLSLSLSGQGTAVSFGQGCAAGQNIATGYAPNPGTGRLSLYQTNGPVGATTLACLGVSSSGWSGQPLPLDLGFLGLPGCTVYTDLSLAQRALASGPVAESFFDIPANLALRNARLYAQFVNLLDPRVNPSLGMTLSNGVELTLGPDVGLPGFSLSRDPSHPDGAVWTYQATVNGVWYDLKGMLFRPSQPPPPGRHYPAIVLNHPNYNSGMDYGYYMGQLMSKWGAVTIAVNYNGAAGQPTGSPVGNNGASHENMLRGGKCLDILGALGYVDMRRVAAHGYSLGGFITGGLVGTYPSAFLTATQVGGGMDDRYTPPFVSSARVRGIRAAIQLHNATDDPYVPYSTAQGMVNVLAGVGVRHELVTYNGGHNSMAFDLGQLAKTRAWFQATGLF